MSSKDLGIDNVEELLDNAAGDAAAAARSSNSPAASGNLVHPTEGRRDRDHGASDPRLSRETCPNDTPVIDADALEASARSSRTDRPASVTTPTRRDPRDPRDPRDRNSSSSIENDPDRLDSDRAYRPSVTLDHYAPGRGGASSRGSGRPRSRSPGRRDTRPRSVREGGPVELFDRPLSRDRRRPIRDDDRYADRRRRLTPSPRRGQGERRDRDRARDAHPYDDRHGGRRRRPTPSPPRRDRRDRRDSRDRRDRPHHGRSRSPRRGGRNRSPDKPKPSEDERDRRTVFVQQLAARLRTRQLHEFFEKAGEVVEAQIVKDRISGRSKGVGYVEFKSEDAIPAALEMTGQKLLNIPIIVQLTEADKNRQPKNTGNGEGNSNPNAPPQTRLYVGNIHFSIDEGDFESIFDPFGEIEGFALQRDDSGRSRGFGFIQYTTIDSAREAQERMNGYELAGRAIRVGFGNDRYGNESTASMTQRFNGSSGHHNNFQGSAFSGAGGRGTHAGGANAAFDRAGGRDNDKAASGASALDDSDVTGVNFNNYSRDALMRKLAREDDGSVEMTNKARQPNGVRPAQRAAGPAEPRPSRCVLLKNMFNAGEEDEENWAKELEDEVKDECDEKYGKVNHIHVDPNSSEGEIYLMFREVQGGVNAIQGLNGRFFNSRQISAQWVVEAVYKTTFPDAP